MDARVQAEYIIAVKYIHTSRKQKKRDEKAGRNISERCVEREWDEEESAVAGQGVVRRDETRRGEAEDCWKINTSRSEAVVARVEVTYEEKWIESLSTRCLVIKGSGFGAGLASFLECLLKLSDSFFKVW